MQATAHAGAMFGLSRRLLQAAAAGVVVSAAALAQGGPSPYVIVNNQPGTFTDISATGTVITAGDDSSMPFTSGVTNALVTTPNLYASTNGNVTANQFPAYANTVLPVGTQTLGLFALWDDLYVDVPGTLTHQMVQEGGIDVEVIQWNQDRLYTNNGLRGTFEIKIFASGPILAQFLYQDVLFASGGSSATIGVQWSSSGSAQYSFNTMDSVAAGTVLSIMPPDGNFPGFSATPRSGASPLLVQFTNESWTSDPAGITGYAWDFDGDSVIDSTEQNPSWTYNDCGTYSVSLSTTDSTHAAATVTRTNYIETDHVTPDFSWESLSGHTVNFTDTTSPSATSWAWDFDGDNLIDSTDQNPTWVFPTTAITQYVRLTANRLCGPSTSVTKLIVTSGRGLPTLLNGGTGTTINGAGNCFDLTVTNPSGVNITGLTMCPYASSSVRLGAPLTVDMYITEAPGGYASNHTNAAAWRLVARGSGNYNGGTFSAPVPVNMTFAHAIYLPPGTYGVALHMNGCGVACTVGTGANQSFGNADMSLALGNLKSARFNTGATTPRVWNGIVYYDLRGGPDDTIAPVANAGSDTTIRLGSVLLDGRGSYDEMTATNNLAYYWTLVSRPANSNATLSGARLGPTGTSFIADVWGEYRVSLVVRDEQGNASQPDEVVFFVPQDTIPPEANAGPDLSIHTGNYVYLDGSASTDDTSYTSALTYEWSLTESPIGSNASLYVYGSHYSYAYFTADMVGVYHVNLIVTDEQGNRSEADEVVISTYNMAPTADAGPDQIGVVNGYVYLGGNSYDPDGDYLSATWTVTSAPTGSSAYVYGYSYYYAYGYFYPDLPGTYEIELVVNDPWGGYSAPDTVTVVVVTPAEWAAIRLGEASTQIGTFDPSVFDAPGHKNSLRNQLAQIATLIRNNNLTQARAHLEEVMSRTDGWVYRYAVDPHGLGQPYEADFIVGYYEQYDIWNRLYDAMYYLNQ